LFDGKTFFEVGNYLRQNSEPDGKHDAMLRSSIGRYYYACYHAAREAFKEKQNWNDHKKSSHGTICKAVRKNCSSNASSLLDTLKIMREHADYHCWLPKTTQMGTIEFTSCPCDWDEDLEKNSREASRIATEVLRELDRHLPPKS